MRSRAFLFITVLLALSGCPGGDGGIGDPCSGHGSCESNLQCVSSVCVPRCQRAPECGDGFSCDDGGLCVLATSQNGDSCESEVDCAPGLSCRIDGSSVDGNGRLTASCTTQSAGKPAGSECTADAECRNGTCAMGRCVDLCEETRDCGAGTACVGLPRIDDTGAVAINRGLFDGCLPSRGSIVWSIPTKSAASELLVAVPASARSATLVFRVDDVEQRVGAKYVFAPNDPDDDPSFQKPCDPEGPLDPVCNPALALDQFYRQRLRHLPEPGQSVLQIPTSPSYPLEPGAYRVRASSFRSDGTIGSAIPHVTAIVKMDAAVNLDLHFHFLDLEDHPCRNAFGNVTLDSARAQDAAFFQTNFLDEIRTIFAGGGLRLDTTTYTDLLMNHDFDALDVADAGALLKLGKNATGINVFFVRTLSPVGLQGYGPNPGPAGLAETQQSGIIIGLDTLCYRSWTQLARLTAHEIARYMGLYHNVELEAVQHPAWRDTIVDSDDSNANLMFFSELGGSELSVGQRDILTRSAVLR